MMRSFVAAVVFTVVAHHAALAAPVTYTDEATYLTALAALSEPIAFEGFEGSDWDGARAPTNVASLASQGISWSPSDNLSTSSGWARTGDWGVYDTPGSPDVMDVSAAQGDHLILGIGGWFKRSTTFAIEVSLDGNLVGGFGPEPLHVFFGVIDPDGFNTVTFAGSNGSWGADDFNFVVVPEPTTVSLVALSLLAMCCRRRKARLAS